MIRKILIGLLLIGILSSLAYAQVYKIDRLYSQPDYSSAVSFVCPPFISFYIIERRGDWIKVRVEYNFWLLGQGKVLGWQYLKKLEY